MLTPDLLPALRRGREALELLAHHHVRGDIIGALQEAADDAIARLAARPVFRWVGDDLFEVGIVGDTQAVRIPRVGAPWFALAVTDGAEQANTLVGMLESRDRRLGWRLGQQRSELAKWLEDAGHLATAAAVRRIRVRNHDGMFSAVSPRP